jgi:16S rRNA (uracil1498-N3)-methyltransferase
MTRRRWIADEVNGDSAALMGAHAGHLVRVLRARIGQQFDIATGDRVRRGTIVRLAEERVEFALAEDVEALASAEVTVLLSVFKFDRMEWAIEKCAELGASKIVPVIARRTDIHLAKAAEKRVERWKRIAVQAAEQSRRAAPPGISLPAKLNLQLLAGFSGSKIVLAESEQELTLKQAVAQCSNGVPISVAVGPEGGWTDDELNLFSREQWVNASLGPTILRAETAAIAALAIVVSEFYD